MVDVSFILMTGTLPSPKTVDLAHMIVIANAQLYYGRKRW